MLAVLQTSPKNKEAEHSDVLKSIVATVGKQKTPSEFWTPKSVLFYWFKKIMISFCFSMEYRFALFKQGLSFSFDLSSSYSK